jgi:hypothetical protein
LKARPSVAKRNREKERSRRKEDKAERRGKRREERLSRGPDDSPEDPDIAGIVPGPQKLDPELFGAESLTED